MEGAGCWWEEEVLGMTDGSSQIASQNEIQDSEYFQEHSDIVSLFHILHCEPPKHPSTMNSAPGTGSDWWASIG